MMVALGCALHLPHLPIAFLSAKEGRRAGNRRQNTLLSGQQSYGVLLTLIY